jgi:hypothetical protein
MGDRLFKKIQYGKELKTAKGTPVAATSMFLGDASVPSDRKYVFPSYNLGVRARASEPHLYQQLVDGFTLNLEDGYFQALPMLISMALKGDITAAMHTTGQSDYDWPFTPSMTASNTQDSFSFEIGDDVQAYLLSYVMAKKITIAGVLGQNQAVKISAECFAKSVVPTTFTGALTIPAIEPMVANNTQLHIDALWANKGTTLKTGLLREYSLEIITGLHPKFHGNGLTMDAHGETYIDAMLRLTLEGNAAADGYYDAMQAKTPYAIQLKIPGSQIGSGQTHWLKAGIWGVFEDIQPMGSEVDGNNLHVALFHGLYGVTGAQILAVDVCTNKATV